MKNVGIAVLVLMLFAIMAGNGTERERVLELYADLKVWQKCLLLGALTFLLYLCGVAVFDI